MESKTSNKGRVFSIELKSKRNLKNINLANGSNDRVYVEGTIGELVQARFEEGVILEVEGKEGIVRMDLEECEIKKSKKNLSARAVELTE